MRRPAFFARAAASADGHTRELFRGASTSFVLKVVGAGLAFVLNVLLARVLGAEGAGLYFLALTAVTVATVFGRVGMDNAVLRFLAAAASREDWAAVQGVYQTGMRLVGGTSAVSALVLFIAAPWIADGVFGEPALTAGIRWMALAVVPFALGKVQAEMLRGLKRIWDSTLVQLQGGVLFPAATIVGVLALGTAYGLPGAVGAYALAAALTCGVGWVLWRRATPHLRGVVGEFSTGALLESGMPLFWSSSINLLMNWTGTVVLGVYAASADVGVFNAASRTAALTSFVLVAVNSIAAPKFAAFYSEGDMQGLERMARQSTWLMVAFAVPSLLLFLAFPGPVMSVFGPEFESGAPVLAILAIGQFVNVATGSVQYLLMMSGHERAVRNCVAVSAAANVALNLALVPLWGILGAAVATAFSVATLNLLAWVQVRSALGIRLVSFPRTASA